MRQSELFTKTLKTAPKDEEAINAKLLIRGGFIRKLSAGVYAYLPLGWRVLEKINKIIREEMNAIGGEELLMPSLVAKEYWEKSGRWNADVIYKVGEQLTVNSQHLTYGLGWTHEEVISYLARDFVSSYKDLPKAVYQIQTKFRNEPRAKNGLLRGREFMMKDLYSFHTDKKDLDNFYQKVIDAYSKILKRLTLKAVVTEACGGAFTKEYTHEFQVLSPAGEDTIFHCDKCDFAQNKEIVPPEWRDSDHSVGATLKCPNCGGEIKESRGIEIANVFKLGSRYSEAYDLRFADKNGDKHLVTMGSYGIGPTRLMATLVEIYNDDMGIIWPSAVAPFKVHLLALGGKEKKSVEKLADKVYNDLEKSGMEVLYDDRDVSAGEKLGDADLLGIPYRAIVSEKAGSKVELKKRSQSKTELVAAETLRTL